MLLRKHRSGHHHSHLLAINHSLEGRTNRNLGLAVAHVAAQQALHRLGLFHISLDFANRLQLVRRFLIGERFLELVLQLGIGAKGVPRHNLALSVQAQKLLRQLRNCLGRLGRGALPIGATHFGKAWHRSLAAHIFMQKANLVHRHIELIITGVG